MAGSGKAEVRELRCLLACCLEGREVHFQKILDGRKKIGFRFSEADYLAFMDFAAGLPEEGSGSFSS
ncbi:MAG: hypothetical protein V8S95_02290 [Odoribacter sp.]